MPTNQADAELSLAIEGMSCGHCQQAVEDALATVQGVHAVEVSLDAGRATVHADAATDASTLVAAVEDAGYEARQG